VDQNESGIDDSFEISADLDSTTLDNLRLELARLVAIYGGRIEELKIEEVPPNNLGDDTRRDGRA
jgi:hypothetical protein